MSVFAQVWLWALVAFLVGALLTWVLLVRPAHQRIRQLERRLSAEQERHTSQEPGTVRGRWEERDEQAPEQAAGSAQAERWPDAEAPPGGGSDQLTRQVRPPWMESDSFSGRPQPQSPQQQERQAQQRPRQEPPHADPQTRFTNPVTPQHPPAGGERTGGQQPPWPERQYPAQYDTGPHPHEGHRDHAGRNPVAPSEHRPSWTTDADRAETGRFTAEQPWDTEKPWDTERRSGETTGEERPVGDGSLEQEATGSELFAPQGTGSADSPAVAAADPAEPAGTDGAGEAVAETVIGAGTDHQSAGWEAPSMAESESDSSHDDTPVAGEPAGTSGLSDPFADDDLPRADAGTGGGELPKRTRGATRGIRGGFEPPKPIQPSMRPVARRKPYSESEHATSGSLFEPTQHQSESAKDDLFTPADQQEAGGTQVGYANQQEGHAAGPFGPGSAMPLPGGGQPSPDFPVKASVTALRYCTADSPQYPRMVAEVWFASAADAERVGFRPLN
ncbi:hypothetical protein [Haloechinothrix sp. LS1_15]|uniref:sunset domain-containing protein n=1 Tax=Haloechinothrix sp. LS1_15 TaxID=2652248 RepID=UPI002946D1F0|nr:hypothetical protein [Haloechinothrix sp. LS1_15]MDV6013174.1 hypothetical protein [Haloechinothrix sp. LS1_15]